MSNHSHGPRGTLSKKSTQLLHSAGLNQTVVEVKPLIEPVIHCFVPLSYNTGSYPEGFARNTYTQKCKERCISQFEYNAPQVSEDRISELLSPFLGQTALSEEQLAAVQIYLELLLKWNAKINLTAIRKPEEIATRHFGESLFAATQIFPDQDSNASLIDIGSGAGFPGLPMKIWAPGIALTLIESNQHKATFLRE